MFICKLKKIEVNILFKFLLYRIQTRVFAQGMVVGALTLSLFYHMYQTYKRPELVQEVSKVVTIVEPSEIIKIKES